MLKKIASRVSDRAGVIAIEASDPVPYVASQPDPRTFVVELREVVALGFADNFSVDPRHPVAAVKVESAKATDGVSVARIRMTLTQPTRPRVRSARNVIYVEADRLDREPAGTISSAPKASAVRDVAAVAGRAAEPFTALTQGTASAAQARVAPARPQQAETVQAPAPATHTARAPQPAPHAAASQAAAPPVQLPANGTQRFTGNAVSLDFQGADLRAVLRTFAEISGLNIVIDPTIQGTVDVALARRAVGPGARHHPARQQARLRRRRHHRARRAAHGAGRRGSAASQAGRRAGALGRAAHADPVAELRARRGPAARC